MSGVPSKIKALSPGWAGWSFKYLGTYQSDTEVWLYSKDSGTQDGFFGYQGPTYGPRFIPVIERLELFEATTDKDSA